VFAWASFFCLLGFRFVFAWASFCVCLGFVLCLSGLAFQQRSATPVYRPYGRLLMLIRFLGNSKIFISKKAFVKNSIFIQYPLKTKQLSF